MWASSHERQGHRAPVAAGVTLVVGIAAVAVLAAPVARAAGHGSTVRTATASDVGTAVLTASVVDGDTRLPLAGAVVTMRGLTAASGEDTRTARSDARGDVRFAGLAGGPDWTYSVSTTRNGTTFTSDPVDIADGATAAATLSVYPVTAVATAVTIPEWTVWVDLEAGGMAVQQDVQLLNSGKSAYLGTTPVPGVPGNTTAAVTLPVAAGATNLQFLGRFEVCCSAMTGTSWSHTRPVEPGQSTGTLRYEAPLVDTLTFPITVPTQQFRLVVPDGTSVSSEVLVKQPGSSIDRGVTYVTYAVTAPAAGSTISVRLSAPATGASPVPWLLAAAAATIAVVIVVVVVRRRRSAPDPGAAMTTAAGRSSRPHQGAAAMSPVAGRANASSTARPTVRPDPRATDVRRHPEPAAPLEPNRDAAELADELAMLDLAWDNGALPDEEAYHRVRDALVGRLVAAVAQDPSLLQQHLG
jgi:hypothetical protein